jgi:pimeloyl-ACP methyl ester carboxylesterase
MQKLAPPTLPDWLAGMLPFERYLLKVGDVHLHVMESGAGRPVLMLHGNPTWGFLYRRVAEALTGEPIRIVLPDLFGLGFSDKPRDSAAHTIDNHARAIGALVDQLGLRDLVLVVQDWGGAIGLRAMADRPERMAGLVLLNTVVGPPRPGFKPTLFHRFARWPIVSDLAFRGLGLPQGALHLAQGDKSSIRGDVARAYRYPLRGWARNVAPLALARMVPNSPTHPSIEPLTRCQQYLERFRGPIGVVWGERDPVLGRVIAFIERLLPQAKVTRTQAGHFLQEEVPAEIAAAVRDVLGALRN